MTQYGHDKETKIRDLEKAIKETVEKQTGKQVKDAGVKCPDAAHAFFFKERMGLRPSDKAGVVTWAGGDHDMQALRTAAVALWDEEDPF